ncbi:LPS-assembly protein LptD [Campylobacter sp. CN_NE4]|nr:MULTISPECIES: LPS-assembly protein LptD [unclassified Campylobacter]MDA3056005.1 LPS-assembly protein LptD [Campylobacter sp. CN_NA1]MDA3065150.1 LPS-assembly protein LptD [Campylobacter sp. CN_NE4]MDA3067975.1 LPS-assembly protein LptD [Campylobacter sp. CN_NE3]MDA3082604.1 LPS-assembly protein LptD [Campylobacter sp. CN_EL2]MDA3083658.1 LPS-assembly protein LptD [Campylobacter sp. CN_NE1]
MFKFLSVILLFCLNLLNAKVQNVELIADDVVKNGDIITATGNVIIYSQDYFVTADRAVYDQKDEVAELFGNVNSMRGLNEASRANYVKLDFKNDLQEADANFIMDKDGEIWMQNDKTCVDSEYYRIKGGAVSSCNVSDPDWKIKFSSAKMNKESKFLHIFNPVFYVSDYPVLYLPYFGFPTDKTRRTGLLPPEIGYIGSEGAYYKQPIYFAPYESWDFQIDPQIRSRRGVGVYGTFRFADSPYSYGEIRGGMFENKSKHQKRLELANKQHHGFEIQYDRSRLVKHLIDGDFKENLWLDFTKLNDLEYYDLVSKGGIDDDSANSLVTSRLNYYLTTDNHYFGLYARYYLDTAKLNSENLFKNNDTVQEIPTLHYHKFVDNFALPNLLYSVDTKAHNYIRDDGVEARHYELNIPVSFSMPLFDEYLNLIIGENLYFSYIDWDKKYNYANGEFSTDNSTAYINNYHLISLQSDLAKSYENFFHTVSFGLDLLIPWYQKGDIDDRLFKYYRYDYDKENSKINKSALNNVKSSLYYEDNFINELSDDYTHDSLAGRFTQYFYDGNGRKFIRHMIKQRYDFDEDEFGELDHSIDFYFKNGLRLGNRFLYSHKYHSFDRIRSYAGYSNDYFSGSLTHSYEYRKFSEDRDRYTKDNYFIANLALNLPNYYKLFGRVDYDLQRDYTKMWRVGVTHNRKCWNFSFVYQEDIEPKNTNKQNYEKASKEQGFYFFVNFYPFGGVGYDFSINHDYTEQN